MSGSVWLVSPTDGITPTGVAANPLVTGGAIASGSADSGAPVKVGGKFNSTLPTFIDGQRGDLQISARGTLLTSYVDVAGNVVSSTFPTVDGNAVFRGANVTNLPLRYNGASWDRDYSNTDAAASLVALTAQTAGTVNSSDQTNFNGRGVNIVVDITAATAMTLTINVQLKDIASGKYVTVLASTALAGVGTTLLQVGPGLPATANVSTNAMLSRTWRVSAIVTGTSVTATVGASVIV